MCGAHNCCGKDIYILHVFRQRVTMPVLKATSISLAQDNCARVMLVEDQASGTQLIQLLRADDRPGVPSPIARRPETDKQSRAMGVSAMIEAGRVHLPDDFRTRGSTIRSMPCRSCSTGYAGRTRCRRPAPKARSCSGSTMMASIATPKMTRSITHQTPMTHGRIDALAESPVEPSSRAMGFGLAGE